MRTAVNSPASWQTRVPHHARSAAAVRRWLADVPAGLGERILADLRTVATELICNAVRHAAALPDGDLVVRCGVDDDIVEFSVTDGGSDTTPRTRSLDTSTLDGRGLLIVSGIAEQWGVTDEPDTRTVWARLAGAG